MCLDSQGSLFLATLWLAAAEGEDTTTRVVRMQVPFKLNRYLLTVLPPDEQHLGRPITPQLSRLLLTPSFSIH
jgi:hypothetical protein